MATPLAILIVEDSDSDAQLIVRLLKKADYEVTFQVVETAAHMRAALAQAAWDIVIADYSLPQFDGPAALRLLQETGLDLPFIAVSGTMGEAAAVAMMKSGAHDYLMKDNLARLAPTVERELRDADTRRERTRAEVALRGSEARYRAIVEDLPVLICRFLPDGTLTFVNDAYCRYFDKSRAELIGHSFTPLIPEEDQAYVLQQFGSLSPAQPTVAYEHRVVAPDGTLRWQRWIDRAMFDGARLIEFQSIGEDITERKQVEELSRVQRDLAQALSTTISLDAALRLCLAAAIRAAGMDAGGIYLVDETSGDLDLVVDDGLSPAFVAGIAHYPADSVSAQLAHAGQPIYTWYPKLGVSLDDVRRREGLSAIAIIPVLHERQVIACLNITSHTLDEVPVFARHALETIAAQIGGTIARLRIGQALRASEAKYRQLVESLNEGIWMIDEQAVTTFVNPRMAEMLGYTMEEMLGRHLFSFMDEQGVQIATLDLARRQQGIKEQHDFEFLRKDGARIYASLETSPVTDRDGAYRGAIAGVIDITARKRAEEALRLSEDRLREILDSLDGLVYVADMQTYETLFVNRYGKEVWGDFTGKTCWQSIQSGQKGPCIFCTNDRLLLPDGAPAGVYVWEFQNTITGQWYECRDSAIRWPDGRTVRLEIAIDITERRQAEEELKQSEARLAAAQAVAKVGSWETDLLNLKVIWSEETYRIFELDPNNFLSSHPGFLDFVHPEDRAQVDAAFVGSFDTHALNAIEHRIVTPGGFVKIIEERWRIFHDDQGRPLRAAGTCQDITERKQAEEALRESEEKFRSIIEYATDGITLTDERGLIVEWNPAQAQIVGRARAEVIGQPLWDIQFQSARPERKTPEVYEKIKALVRDMLASGEIPEQAREQETTFQGSDGVERVSRSAVFSIKTARGFRLASISHDITERKQAEEALRANRRQLTDIIEFLPDATLAIDGDKRVIIWNKVIEEMTGVPAAEMIGQGGHAYTIPFYGEARPQLMDLLFEDRAEIAARYPTITREGDTLMAEVFCNALYNDKGAWVSAKASPLHDQFGNIIGAIESIRDITARKQAEAEIQKLNAELEERVIERTAELARQRERERAILDAMGEGVVFTDRAGTIEYINPAMERLTGFTAQESVGQNPRLWQSGQTSPAVYRQMWDTITRGEMWQGELVNRHQDGRLYEIALTAAPLTNPDRQIIGYVGVQRDITRQKELERLKDKFVSNVNHELRTPLTSIMLNLDLIDHGKPEKRPHYLATLRREAERLRKLIEDLLDIARLDRQTAPVELAPIDLQQLLEPLVADRATVAAERGLMLEFLPTAESPLALAEVSMLTQVVSNLITNALNYTPAGGSVTVQTHHQRTAAQDWITLTVRDTGPGIAAHELPHMFERFYRGEVGRKASAPGTGLGLAISKEIAEKLGGRITVESQSATEGRGAAFTVWLRPPP